MCVKSLSFAICGVAFKVLGKLRQRYHCLYVYLKLVHGEYFLFCLTYNGNLGPYCVCFTIPYVHIFRYEIKLFFIIYNIINFHCVIIHFKV